MSERRLGSLAVIFGQIATWMPTLGLKALFSNIALVLSELADIYSSFHVNSYGGIGNGIADDTQAILDTIAAMPATASVIRFSAGTYNHTGLKLTRRGLRFIGERDGRVNQGGGTRLVFTPTAAQQLSPCSGIDIGVSGVVGDPFFDATYENGPGGIPYNGLQETYFENISFGCNPATTGTIINAPTASYGINTVGIRDYYGGSVRMRGVQFENFDYPFWGVHSDFDRLEDVVCLYCNHGPYFGPRSDQLTTHGLQVNNCNDGLWLDRCTNSLHNGLRIIDCGDPGGTRFGLKMGNQYTAADASGGHIIVAPWLEIGGGATAGNIEAYIQIGGDSDAQPTKDITIIRPKIVTGLQTATPHANYLARIGNASRIRIIDLTSGHSNLLKTFKFSHATTNSHVIVDTHDDLVPTYDNVGAAVPVVSYRSSGYGEPAKLGGSNGRLWVTYTNQAAGYANEYYLGSESQLGFFVVFPNRSGTNGEKNLLAITRRIQHGTAPPIAGTWTQGDEIKNSSPAVGQPKSWLCVASGTPGTWQSTGNL